MYQGGMGQNPPIDWNTVIASAITTTGQILAPRTYQPTSPVYSPASTAVGQAAQSPGLWIAAAVLGAFLLLRRR